MSSEERLESVEVVAPARIHLGFYNFKSGDLEFGSLGLAVNAPTYRILLRASDKVECSGIRSENILEIVRGAVERLKVSGVEVYVREAIPLHVGFGSTTQLILSIYHGLSKLYNLGLSIDRLAEISGRGLVSRIGIESFKRGGFIVDSGRVKGSIPKLLLRIPFPNKWRIITITPLRRKGLREDEEVREILLPEVPSDEFQKELVKTAFLGVIPGVLNGDFELYTSSLEKLQLLVGEYYSKVQGGIFSSEDSLYVAEKLKNAGGRGVGQSSWGPTVYGFFEDWRSALKSFNTLKKELEEEGLRCNLRILKGRNSGAKVYQSTS